MTPNTLPVVKVFTCEVRDANDAPNELFLEGLRTALVEAKVPLHVIPDEDHLGDRWIQDEVEFGYVQGATHFIPVVFDSPRDRQLDGFPEKSLLGPDLGHFQIGGSRPNSLDSFGNLEVSPPVVVNGRNYPFGRIVFGGRQHGDYSDVSRAMMPEVRKFLYSQKVQSPFEIFTDWLTVGHVDEIVCFVPAPTRLGFKVLLASPESAKALLTRLSKSGHGKIPMFVGRRRANGASAELSIDALLGDRSFWTANDRF